MSRELTTTRECLAYGAVKNNEILALMKGERQYFYTDRYCSGPFDSYEVLGLLYAIDEFDKHINVCELFKEALQILLNGNSDDLYSAIIYFVNHIYNENTDLNSFKLDSSFKNNYLDALRKKISINKDVLQKEKSIYGVNKWWSIEKKNTLFLKSTNSDIGIL